MTNEYDFHKSIRDSLIPYLLYPKIEKGGKFSNHPRQHQRFGNSMMAFIRSQSDNIQAGIIESTMQIYHQKLLDWADRTKWTSPDRFYDWSLR